MFMFFKRLCDRFKRSLVQTMPNSLHDYCEFDCTDRHHCSYEGPKHCPHTREMVNFCGISNRLIKLEKTPETE
jgi:hypothetical protein